MGGGGWSIGLWSNFPWSNYTELCPARDEHVCIHYLLFSSLLFFLLWSLDAKFFLGTIIYKYNDCTRSHFQSGNNSNAHKGFCDRRSPCYVWWVACASNHANNKRSQLSKWDCFLSALASGRTKRASTETKLPFQPQNHSKTSQFGPKNDGFLFELQLNFLLFPLPNVINVRSTFPAQRSMVEKKLQSQKERKTGLVQIEGKKMGFILLTCQNNWCPISCHPPQKKKEKKKVSYLITAPSNTQVNTSVSPGTSASKVEWEQRPCSTTHHSH